MIYVIYKDGHCKFANLSDLSDSEYENLILNTPDDVKQIILIFDEG